MLGNRTVLFPLLFQFVDIDDIDFQTSTSKLVTRWSGFEHPHEDINFTVCISNASSSSSEFIMCERSYDSERHVFVGLDLVPYEVIF